MFRTSTRAVWVRWGFRQSTLGPRAASPRHAGGPKKITRSTANGDCAIPRRDGDKMLRLFAFTDVEGDRKVDRMRASVGMGISWISPVGPLRIAV